MVLILKRQDFLHDSWLRAARKKKLHYFIPVHHIVTSLSHKDSLWACWYPFPLQGGDNQSPLHTWVSAQEYNTETQSGLWTTLFDLQSSAFLSILPKNTIQWLSQGSELHFLIQSSVHYLLFHQIPCNIVK